ncbi:hypothetical protein B0I35DRAFT_434280 [Stachybotrys elegans]|uniref:Uncharacterized protein n=1 Tax=Stachybotrys elegans TaxID=80388 RepID=A0A8K0SNU8_9HYPO|nr:hypothetical protein B0I35DRAFT_434280 [Stachybotrys elegans]
MDSSHETEFRAYRGVWINWSRGPILGSTLTLTRSEADILIAFTSFFVALVGTRFWRIICILLHRFNSRPFSRTHEGPHHQNQLILRNSHSAESGLYASLRLALSWQRSSKKSITTVLPSILSSACTLAAFILASGFSATISSSAGREVLLDGANCGLPIFNTSTSSDQLTVYQSTTASNLANYVQQCYSSEASGLLDCARFIRPSLSSTVDGNASCPFQGGICKSDNKNLRIDSGYINSNVHLGVNAPSEDNIWLRVVFECAPLVTDGYTTDQEFEDVNYTRYHYGSRFWGNDTSNVTYAVESLSAQYRTRQPETLPGTNFMARSFVALAYNGSLSRRSTFIPTPELQRLDGDVALAFLSGNGVLFAKPTLDPWYEATRNSTSVPRLADSQSRWFYSPVQAASPLACVIRQQLCYGSSAPTDSGENSNCGKLASFTDARVSAFPLFDIDPQSQVIPEGESRRASRYRWFESVWDGWTSQQLGILHVSGPSVLPSQRRYRSGIQGPLPDNQWQLDMTHLWNICLAALQANFVNTAIGPTRPELQESVQGPETAYQKEMCTNQKVLSTRYGSFSMFGLCFTYVVGALIIVISLALPAGWDYHFQRTQKKLRNGQAVEDKGSMYRYLEWTTNETLQQNRLAQEGVGWGGSPWRNCTDYMPIPAEDGLLGSLDISDLNHPVLYRPEGDPMEKTRTEAATESLHSTTLPKRSDLGTASVVEIVDGEQHVEPDHPDTNNASDLSNR